MGLARLIYAKSHIRLGYGGIKLLAFFFRHRAKNILEKSHFPPVTHSIAYAQENTTTENQSPNHRK